MAWIETWDGREWGMIDYMSEDGKWSRSVNLVTGEEVIKKRGE